MFLSLLLPLPPGSLFFFFFFFFKAYPIFLLQDGCRPRAHDCNEPGCIPSCGAAASHAGRCVRYHSKDNNPWQCSRTPHLHLGRCPGGSCARGRGSLHCQRCCSNQDHPNGAFVRKADFVKSRTLMIGSTDPPPVSSTSVLHQCPPPVSSREVARCSGMYMLTCAHSDDSE